MSTAFYEFGIRDVYPKELTAVKPENFVGEENVNQLNEIKTHEMKDENGKLSYYREYSKDFREVDPHVVDPHNIQTYSNNHTYLLVKTKSGEWTLPHHVPESRISIDVAFSRLRHQLLGDRFFVKDKERFPVGAIYGGFAPEDIEANKLLG